MSEGRVINFSAGPSALPLDVIERIKSDLINWNGSGVSIMEMSHRSKEFESVFQETKSTLKELLNIPDDYSILFMQGGGTGQFSAVPLNLLNNDEKGDYVVTGYWSQKAFDEAKKFKNVFMCNKGCGDYDLNEWKVNDDSKYVYFCSNETIDGVEILDIPSNIKDKEKIVVTDMSSNFLSKRINIKDYGLIFAGTQKNAGIAGLVIVIIRNDLLKDIQNDIPTCLSYLTTYKGDSLVNTPPTFAIYVSGLMFKWIKEQGGIDEMERRNEEKSKILYEYIDSSNGFYKNNVIKKYRSRMNVTFRIKDGDDELENKFVKLAGEKEMISLKGHRSVGGLRVSLYNAITIENVKKLISFMEEFKLSNQ